jgi:hypothetical protein
VDRIPAAAEQAGLRALPVERNAEREHLAGADQARRPHDVLRHDVIERADLIVFAPAPPVLSFSVASAIAFLPTVMSIQDLSPSDLLTSARLRNGKPHWEDVKFL